MSETISFDFQFHYVLNKPERHSMDAMVFNCCEKQIISSFYQLLELWGINKEDVVIDVLSREEGGVKELFRVFTKDYLKPVLLTLLTIWAERHFNTDIDNSNVIKNNIEIAQTIKEAGFTQEEAEALVADDPRLMDFCSKYYKALLKEPAVSKVDTTINNTDNTSYYSGSVSSGKFLEYVVEVKKYSNVVKGTTLKIASPVLADVKHLKWRGVYNQLPISFTIEDFDFIDKVHNKVVKFEYGTTIQCDLRIEETHAGNKVHTPKYIVEKVYSWYDGETLEIREKRYLSIEDAEAELIPNEIKLIEKKED